MSATYTKYDWASDRFARMSWAEEEDRLMERIDQKRNKKNNKRNRRNKR